MDLACISDSMETVCSPCVDLSAIPIKELKGTKLEREDSLRFEAADVGSVPLYEDCSGRCRG